MTCEKAILCLTLALFALLTAIVFDPKRQPPTPTSSSTTTSARTSSGDGDQVEQLEGRVEELEARLYWFTKTQCGYYREKGPE